MAGSHNLSEGCLQMIMKGTEIKEPIVQILGTKKINSGNSDKERYRILLSDGKFTISFAMLTTQMNDKCVPNYSVIKIKKYITSMVNNSAKGEQRVLLILDLDLLTNGDEIGHKLGNPVPLSDAAETSTPKPSAPTSTSTQNGINTKPATTNGTSNGNLNLSSVNTSGQITHPISSLSPYHNKWVIKARVTSKSTIRTWANSRGEGKLFNVDFIDESGEIRCTAFRDLVDKFYELLQVDKVYYISKCQIKPANKQFTSIKNDYEMTMTNDTTIQECEEQDNNIPQTKYNFVPIDKIVNLETGILIDVIGICKSVGDLLTFQARATGRELKKKEVTLVDQSRTAVALTLWGTEAENFDGTNNPVIVLKGVKIGEFGGGKNLSTIAGSQIRCNPELPECYRLRGWYDSEGNQIDTTNISARTGVGSFNTPWMSFKEVQDQQLGNAEKGDYYQVLGTILLVRSENAIYKACPAETCNKKVVDMGSGMYRCENCNTEYPNHKYRLLASMNVGDWSGNQWISMFNAEAETVVGMTAAEVGAMIETNPEAMASIVDKANFKQFVLKCRAKMEKYNDEARLKTVAVKVDPIDYESYNAHVIERIQQLMST